MALTKVTGHVVKTDTNLHTHNINSSGIVTAISLDISGNVSVGGTLTYQDVTNVDSVGIITARAGIIDNTLTAGRVVYVDSDKSLTDSANLTFNGSDLTVGGKVSCDVNSDISMSSSAAGQLVVGGDGYTSAIALDGDAMHIYHNSSSRGLVLGTNETERLRITGAGKVGIGTDDPDHNLHLWKYGGDSVLSIESQGDGNHSAIEFLRTSSGGDSKGAGSIYVTGDTGASEAKMQFGVGHNISHGQLPRMTIMGNGEVGIGTDNPGYKLTSYQTDGNTVTGHFKTNQSSSYIAFQDSGSGGAAHNRIGSNGNDLVLWSYNDERLRIDSNGTVLVGTTDTTVYNNSGNGNDGIVLRGGNVIDIARSSDLQLTLNRLVDDGAMVAFYRDGAHKATINIKDSALTFATNGNQESFRIESNGKIAIGNHTGASHDIHIKHASSPGIRLEDTTNSVKLTMFAQDSNSGIANFSDHPLLFYTNSLNRIQITNDGKVQIGLPGNSTSLPGAVDTVSIRARDEGNLHIRDIGNLTSSPAGTGVGIDVLNNASNAVKDLCIRASTLIFRNASDETLRITSDGKLGIGIVNPTEFLSLHRTNAKVGWGVEGNYGVRIGYWDNGGGTHGFHVDRKHAGTITSHQFVVRADTGNVGIGLSTPVEKFEVSGGNIAIVGGTSYKIDTHPLVSYASFTDISGGSYAARLGSTGTSTIRSTQIYGGGGHIATFDGVNNRLGISITAPTKKLDIATAASADGIRIKSTGNTYNELQFDANRTSANTHLGRIISYWNGTAVSYISMDAGSDTTNKDDGIIRFWTANGSGNYERLRITSGGDTEIKGDLYVKTTYPRIYLLDTDSNSDFSLINDNGDFSIYDDSNSAHRLRINSSGYIGMGGNTNPTNVLHIKTSVNNTAVATIESTATDSYPFLRLKNDAREYQLTCHGPLSDVFTIYDGTAGAHRLTITSNGNVEINTPPWSVTGGDYRNLSISGETASSSGFIWLGNGAAATNADFDLGRINFCNGGTIVARVIGTTDTSNNDDGVLRFNTKATGATEAERMRITSTGNIIIGTAANAGNKVYFQSTSGSAHWIQSTGTNNQDLQFGRSTSEYMRIDNGGRIRIGRSTKAVAKGALIIDNEQRNALADRSDPDNYAIVLCGSSTSDEGNGIAFCNDNAQNTAAAIIAVDRGSNNLGDLRFYTKHEGSPSNGPLEGLRINQQGQITGVTSGVRERGQLRTLESMSMPKWIEGYSNSNNDLSVAASMFHQTHVRGTGHLTTELFSTKMGGNAGMYVQVEVWFSCAVSNFQGYQMLWANANRTSWNNFTINNTGQEGNQLGTDTAQYFNLTYDSSGSGADQRLTWKVVTSFNNNYVRCLYKTTCLGHDYFKEFNIIR